MTKEELHTTGPVSVAYNADTGWSLYAEEGDAPGYEIARMQRHSVHVKPGFRTVVSAERNARRMAACWNACQHLKTEALEGAGVPRLLLETLAAGNREA